MKKTSIQINGKSITVSSLEIKGLNEEPQILKRYNHTFFGSFEHSEELKKQLEKLGRDLRKRKSRFEKFYDSVSNFLFGGKAFFTKKSYNR